MSDHTLLTNHSHHKQRFQMFVCAKLKKKMARFKSNSSSILDCNQDAVEHTAIIINCEQMGELVYQWQKNI